MAPAEVEAKVAGKAAASKLEPEVVAQGEEEEPEAPKPTQVMPSLLQATPVPPRLCQLPRYPRMPPPRLPPPTTKSRPRSASSARARLSTNPLHRATTELAIFAPCV